MRATLAGRAAAPLQCLLPDEAAFIDAAFERILPEAAADGLKVSASRYVDAKLARAAARAESSVSDPALTLYRSAIADVQAHCKRTLGRRFQILPVWQQLAVLAQLEHAPDAVPSLQDCLIDQLLTDAAEAYFDVAARPSAAVANSPDVVAV